MNSDAKKSRTRASRSRPTELEDPDLRLVADHEAVGARLGLPARDGDVAAEQRGLHAPVEVADRGALEQDRVLDLGALDHAAAADRGVRADVGVAHERARADDRRPAHGRPPEHGPGLDDDAAVDLRAVELAVDPALERVEDQAVGLPPVPP